MNELSWRSRAVADLLGGGGPVAWKFTLANGADHAATARLEDDWLVMEVRPAEGSASASRLDGLDPWMMLRRNAGLAGTSRLVAGSGGVTPCLRNEVMLSDRNRVVADVAACRSGLEDALDHLSRKNGDLEAPPVAQSDVPASLALDGLQSLGAECGWQLEARGEARLAAGLDVERGTFNARLVPLPHGGVHAWVTLLESRALSGDCRRALAHLLTTAAEGLRLARGSVAGPEDRPEVVAELRYETGATAADLERMLEALTAYCWVCGPEVSALRDERVARRYLKSFGGALMAAPN